MKQILIHNLYLFICSPLSSKAVFLNRGSAEVPRGFSANQHSGGQGRTDHLETRAPPEGPGSVGGPMRCPWYLFHRLF
ncbi:unnamed protein product [Staurois parvus]|uniref:Secreted protein n=1 Tax=Staurois parvus TaxID=386267 RepID=A0ABN9BSP7_9NEOB|nr:unnamed protein product [Staurois parvus]